MKLTIGVMGSASGELSDHGKAAAFSLKPSCFCDEDDPSTAVRRERATRAAGERGMRRFPACTLWRSRPCG